MAWIVLFALLSPACKSNVDLEADRRELLRIHELGREAHFEKNAAKLVSTFADDYVNLSAGEIRRPTKEEATKRFQGYFDRSTFLEWDDLSEPTIRVSSDGSMAYAIVHKKVRLVANDESGKPVEEETVFAWMEVYEKQNGVWKLKAVASTNEPEKKP